MTRLSHTA